MSPTEGEQHELITGPELSRSCGLRCPNVLGSDEMAAQSDGALTDALRPFPDSGGPD